MLLAFISNLVLKKKFKTKSALAEHLPAVTCDSEQLLKFSMIIMATHDLYNDTKTFDDSSKRGV